MWSRKPTPVSRVPCPMPSRSSDEAHIGLGGSALDRGGAAHGRCILPYARLHRFGVHLEALGAGDRRAGRGERARRRRRCAPRPCGGGSGAARASRRSARRRRWAARGWSRRRSRRTRSRCRRRRTGSRRCATLGASASISAPISCRCSGANALASATASRAPATSTIAKSASPTVGRSTTSRSSAAASASQAPAALRDGRRRGCPSPCSACASMSSAARFSSRSPACAEQRTSRSLGPGEAVDPDGRARAGAWPPARTGCPGPTITSTRVDRLGAVGQRGDRLGAAHAVDALDAAQPAGAEDQRVDLPVGARRRAHGDSSTPAARAVTTPITTVLG